MRLSNTCCVPGIEAPPLIVTRRVGAVGKMNFILGNLKADASMDRFLGRQEEQLTHNIEVLARPLRREQGRVAPACVAQTMHKYDGSTAAWIHNSGRQAGQERHGWRPHKDIL